MKTTIGRVRRFIREATALEQDMNEYEDFAVGEHYYVPGRYGHPGAARECTRIYKKDSGPGYGEQVFVSMKSPGTTSTMLSSRWIELGVRPASPEEIEDQVGADASARDYMARNIDTSREGT